MFQFLLREHDAGLGQFHALRWGDLLDNMGGVEHLWPGELLAVLLEEGFHLLDGGDHCAGDHLLLDALDPQVAFAESPKLGDIEGAAAAPLRRLAGDLSVDGGVLDGARIGCRALLDQDDVLRGLLRSEALLPRPLGGVGDLVPSGVTADADVFLADQLFGDKLAVDEAAHRLFGSRGVRRGYGRYGEAIWGGGVGGADAPVD